MFDIMSMMGKVKEMQARINEAQGKLILIKAVGESGGGMIKAVVNGKKQLVSIDIDPSILNSADKVLIQDLVIAAINKALDEVEVKSKEELRKSTEGILPNIPGFDLTGMMG